MHLIMFQDMACSRKYMIVSVILEFDVTMNIKDKDSDKYDTLDFNLDTYDCFHVYYDKFAEIDSVTLYKKGGVCNSEDQ